MRSLGGISFLTFAWVFPLLAQENILVDPPAFKSEGHQLDLLMLARPASISIAGLTPAAWVYEVCLRRNATGNACPANEGTAAPYGGVRLALEPGDHLKIRLVNMLPPVPPDAEHTKGPMGDMLVGNPTNLHTHGLIVEPRRPTALDPTYGDYVYLLAYPSGKLPLMKDPGLDYTDQPVDYDIYIPKDHPSGLFWFHPHAHGLSLNQVSEGLAGIITVGSPFDTLADSARLQGVAAVRHLTLKDIQVLPDGRVIDQEIPTFCNPEPDPGERRRGSCDGVNQTEPGGNAIQLAGGKWIFSVNGQVYPTIPITNGKGEIWRFTNASGSRAYDLVLNDDASGKPLTFQVLAVDGVTVESNASVNTLGSRLRNRIVPAACPVTAKGPAFCATSLRMLPSSRVEIWISAHQPDSSGTATLSTRTVSTGESGDHWPSAKLAKVTFKNPRECDSSLEILRTQSGAASVRKGILGNAVRISDRAADEITVSDAQKQQTGSPSLQAHLATLTSPWAGAAVSCKALSPGHRRRIFFGLPTQEPDGFGLGYEEVEADGRPVPGTFQDIEPFEHSHISICLPLGPGNLPVNEDWELVNVANEDHNFHIHQTKFRVLAASPGDSETGAMVDNVPVLHGSTGCDGSVGAWRNGACQTSPVLVNIPFSQVGDFVYHCHILEHEDGGMMAHIRVTPH